MKRKSPAYKTTWTEVQNTPGIYLVCPGSNSVWAGFRTMGEAIICSMVLPEWKIVDWKWYCNVWWIMDNSFQVILQNNGLYSLILIGTYSNKIWASREYDLEIFEIGQVLGGNWWASKTGNFFWQRDENGVMRLFIVNGTVRYRTLYGGLVSCVICGNTTGLIWQYHGPNGPLQRNRF